jgi:hypothetical protein
MGGETYVLPGPENRKKFQTRWPARFIGPGSSLTTDGRQPWSRLSAVNVREFAGCWPIAWSFGVAENCDSVNWICASGRPESSPNASRRKEKISTCASGAVPRAVASESLSISPFRNTRSLPLAVLTRWSSAQVDFFLAMTNGR